MNLRKTTEFTISSSISSTEKKTNQKKKTMKEKILENENSSFLVDKEKEADGGKEGEEDAWKQGEKKHLRASRLMKILEMKEKGKTFQEIGDFFKISKQRAWELYRRGVVFAAKIEQIRDLKKW